MNKLVFGSLILWAAATLPGSAVTPQMLPPALASRMKSGKKIAKIWVSPAFDGSKGIAPGTIDSAVSGAREDVLDYLPAALERIALAGSPNVLSVTVVELKVVDKSDIGYESATIGIEGKVVDQTGAVVVAFAAREEASNREDTRANCHAAVDRIVWSLTQDLGKAFEQALAGKRREAAGLGASAPLPPPPPPSAQPLDPKMRLFQLEDLKKRGLITDEEYQTHRKEILNGK